MIKLTGTVHHGIHVLHAVLGVGVVMLQFQLVRLQHYRFGQVDVLVILSCTKFLQWTHERSGRMHFLHYLCHVLRCCIFNSHLFHYISWNPAFVFLLKVFVIHELFCHYSIYFSEIL